MFLYINVQPFLSHPVGHIGRHHTEISWMCTRFLLAVGVAVVDVVVELWWRRIPPPSGRAAIVAVLAAAVLIAATVAVGGTAGAAATAGCDDAVVAIDVELVRFSVDRLLATVAVDMARLVSSTSLSMAPVPTSCTSGMSDCVD